MLVWLVCHWCCGCYDKRVAAAAAGSIGNGSGGGGGGVGRLEGRGTGP